MHMGSGGGDEGRRCIRALVVCRQGEGIYGPVMRTVLQSQHAFSTQRLLDPARDVGTDLESPADGACWPELMPSYRIPFWQQLVGLENVTRAPSCCLLSCRSRQCQRQQSTRRVLQVPVAVGLKMRLARPLKEHLLFLQWRRSLRCSLGLSSPTCCNSLTSYSFEIFFACLVRVQSDSYFLSCSSLVASQPPFPISDLFDLSCPHDFLLS